MKMNALDATHVLRPSATRPAAHMGNFVLDAFNGMGPGPPSPFPGQVFS